MPIGVRDLGDMTELQRYIYEEIANGPRKSVPSPFLAMLDAPRIARAIQEVGATIRFLGVAPPAVRETAILATAGAFGSGYEWDYHASIARCHQVPESVISATKTGSVNEIDVPVLKTVVEFSRAAVLERQTPQHLLSAIIKLSGYEVASEVVAIVGYYQMLALFLSAGEFDRPIEVDRDAPSSSATA
jgi:4-carboxymuconolactone decarboxylase